MGELSAGIVRGAPTLVQGIGEAIIRSKLVPGWFRRFGIEQAGTSQKPLLILGIVVSTLILGIGLGLLVGWLGARSQKGDRHNKYADLRFLFAAVVFAFFGLIGGLTLKDSPASSTVHSVLTPIFAVLLGYFVLVILIAIAESRIAFDKGQWGERGEPTAARRNFILGAGATAIISGFGSLIGRQLINYQRSANNRDEVMALLEDSTATTTTLRATQNFDHINGIAPIITPTEDFYLIDTAISYPLLNHETWKLKVKGMVENELTISFQELLDMGLEEATVTLSCVSNPIGGSLVGNAVWRGVPLKKILDEAGVDPTQADQIVGRSEDNWTAGFPTQIAYEPDRPSMVAVQMNGEPLTRSHGFPARLVVAGLYGYVSATKWLKEIELTTWDGYDAYWIPRGWSKEGPVKTQSRIDVPRHNSTLVAGPNTIAGIAWAPNRGVKKVEVRTFLESEQASRTANYPEWQTAKLSDDITDNAWRQWQSSLNLEPGSHILQVRATDGTGITQTRIRTNPEPNGASGWHAILVHADA